MPRKKPAAKSKRPSPKPAPKKSTPIAKPASKPAVRFWVPPVVSPTIGGTVVKKSHKAPGPKFWTPEQYAFPEQRNGVTVATEWDRDVEGISYSRQTVESVNGTDVTCIWYGSPQIGGLAAVGYPGHERRLIAFLRGVATDYEPSNGYCVDCDSSTNGRSGWTDDTSKPACEGARWVLTYLERRAAVAGVLDTELERINSNGGTKNDTEKTGGAGSGARAPRGNSAGKSGRNSGGNSGRSGRRG